MLLQYLKIQCIALVYKHDARISKFLGKEFMEEVKKVYLFKLLSGIVCAAVGGGMGANMNNKRINLVWSISLIIIGIATLIISISSIVGITLPDILRRCLGVIELISLFVLVYTSVRKKYKKC